MTAAPSGTTGKPPRPGVRIAAAGVAGSFLVFWAAFYLNQPFGQDHGIFAWVGNVIRGGGMPYRDAWDIKGPAVYAGYAIIQTVGAGARTLRLADLGILMLSGILLYRVGRWTMPRAGAVAAVAIALLWYASLSYENTAQPEGWVAALALGVVALAGPGRALGPGRVAIQGMLLGLAVLVKPTFALFGMIPLVAILIGAPAWSERVRLAIALAVGAGLVIAAGIAWLALGGALSEYLDVHLAYTASTYRGDSGLPTAVSRMGRELLGSPAMALAVVAGLAGIIAMLGKHRPLAAIHGAWALAGFLVLVLGKFFPYHWVPLYPVLALLAVTGSLAVAEWLSNTTGSTGWRAVLLVAAVAVLGGGSAVRVLRDASGWWTSIGDDSRRASYERRLFGEDGRHDAALPAVAEYLASEALPGDPVQMFGQDAVVYHLSGRMPPTRFGTSQPVLSGPGSRFRAKYREEFMRGLDAYPPLYIVARDSAGCEEADRRGLLHCLEAYPEFQDWVERGYVRDRVVGPYVVYRRAAPADSPGTSSTAPPAMP